MLERHLARGVRRARDAPRPSGDLLVGVEQLEDPLGRGDARLQQVHHRGDLVSGWVNWRVYWMNACTSPSDSDPLATRSPPTTAITT